MTPDLLGLTLPRPDDAHVFREVVTGDCYRLAELTLPARPLIVDVGAHVGCFTAFALHLWPDAEVVAAECCPENLPLLVRNVGGRAQVVAKAVTHHAGPVGLLNCVGPTSPTTGASEVMPVADLLAHRHNPAHYWPDLRPLPAATLDDLVGERAVDLLKLDCEGSEFGLLEHSRCLDRCRVVVGEWHGRSAWERLVAGRLSGWTVEVLRDGENGLFRLTR